MQSAQGCDGRATNGLLHGHSALRCAAMAIDDVQAGPSEGNMRSGPRRAARFNIAYMMLATAPLCWAGNHVLGRYIAGKVPPGGLSTLRWLLAAVILAPFALPHLRQDWPALKAKPWSMLLLAMTGGGLFATLQFFAANWTTALNMSLLNSVAPIMILIASRVLFGDRLRWSQLVGVCISFSGLVSIATQGQPSRLLALAFETGDLFVLFNMMLWATYCAGLRLRPDVHWLSFTFVLAVLSSLNNVPIAIYEIGHGHPLEPTGMTLLAIVYSAVFTSVVAYATWNRGVELIGAQRSSAFLHLIPLYGAALATTLLGESIYGFHIAGGALILSGVWLAARPAPAGR